MRRLPIREFRKGLADAIEGNEPIVVTRHGRSVAVVYPLGSPGSVPTEVRRSVIDAVGNQLGLPPRWPSVSPVIERYKRDVDRTLIRENLRHTPNERLRALQKLQAFADELRRAR